MAAGPQQLCAVHSIPEMNQGRHVTNLWVTPLFCNCMNWINGCTHNARISLDIFSINCTDWIPGGILPWIHYFLLTNHPVIFRDIPRSYKPTVWFSVETLGESRADNCSVSSWIVTCCLWAVQHSRALQTDCTQLGHLICCLFVRLSRQQRYLCFSLHFHKHCDCSTSCDCNLWSV